MTANYFPAHLHSQFSYLDATAKVPVLVQKTARMKQPAFSITDHGNGGGWVQGYKETQKLGLPFFPGMEGYLCTEPITGEKGEKLDRYHVGLLSLNFEGYKNLVKFTSLSHTRPRFNRFPRFDIDDMWALAQTPGSKEGLALTTGCFFGLVQQTLVHKGELQAQRVVEMYAKMFPHTFVELQNHGINHIEQAAEDDPWTSPGLETDDELCQVLYDIAQRVGLPVLATQDSHYCDQKESLAHNLMKRMVYGGENNEFPGDSFHLASALWMEEHHDPIHWDSSEQGYKHLLGLNDLEIPPLDKYTIDMPSTKRAPRKFITTRCRRALAKLQIAGKLNKPYAAYVKELDKQLAVCEALGEACWGYFTIYVEFLEMCEEKGIFAEARGSANGSLICYLLGITQPDPLKYNLMAERFLSDDRLTPPDIDMDVEDVHRPYCVEWIEKRFGVEQIGTYAQLGSRDNDDKGSILVSYNSYLRKKVGNSVFVPKYGRGLETVSDVKRVSNADYQGLRILAKSEVFRSYGVHPSGLLLNGQHLKISDVIPTMLVASSNTRVTQFSQDDAESFGLNKMDILGQRTLTIMRRCQEMMGKKNPRDFKWIPDNDKETCRMLSRVQAGSGIFQFDGWSMAKGARMLKIRSTMDCITAGALFRPACMDSGMTDRYLERRFDLQARKDAEHPHVIFEEVLKPTYGVVLFQEQVLTIMRRMGMDIAGINQFFKILKDSGKGATARNEILLAKVKMQWAALCDDNGIDDPDAAWEYIEGYTKYGFNKAHATGYGIRSYRIAYLKCHHPLEYMAALLESNAGKPVEREIVTEARRIGIRLLPADVNISGQHWTIDRKKNAIRKGLSSIKGIGFDASQDITNHAPYDTIEEMIEKVDNNRSVSGAPKYKKTGEFSGNLAKLREAGALASLGFGRSDYE